MALNAYRVVADALTGLRLVAGVALAVRPSVGLVVVGIATDWIDGAIARLGDAAPYGARFDLEADSVLTLGAAIAATRRGSGRSLLVAPILRYAVVAARDPRTYTPRERFFDRVSGIAQMAVLVGSLSPWPLRLLSLAAFPVTAARCATLAALLTRGAVQSGPRKRPAEARFGPDPGIGAPEVMGAPAREDR